MVVGRVSSAVLAVYLQKKHLSYAELDRQVDRLARHLSDSGVSVGDVLALFSQSSWLTTLLLHACAKVGATFYPVDPELPPQWQHELLQQAGVEHVIRHDSIDDTLEIDPTSLEITALGAKAERGTLVDDIAVIIATSGSSGAPRGVMLGNRAVQASAAAVNAKLDLAAGDCWLNCLPLYHVGGLSIVYRTALAGASMVLQQGFDAGQVWRDIKRYPVTHISLVPVMLAKLLDEADCMPPVRLKSVLVGGAALNEKLASRAFEAGWPLCVTYGMTETASQVATRCFSGNEDGAGMQGYASALIDGVECEVVDGEGRITAQVGQVRIRGGCLMSGYANSGRIAGDGLDEVGWFTSGDLGRLDERGFLRIVGRADEMLISGGENVNPYEVEMLMLDCPGIDAVCVIGVTEPVWGQRVSAVYSGPFNEMEVEHWCRQEIKGALRPRQFVRLSHLPRLSTGKIDRLSIQREYGPQIA
jgi:O-succinylbenzoic acid--CoA ligase